MVVNKVKQEWHMDNLLFISWLLKYTNSFINFYSFQWVSNFTSLAYIDILKLLNSYFLVSNLLLLAWMQRLKYPTWFCWYLWACLLSYPYLHQFYFTICHRNRWIQHRLSPNIDLLNDLHCRFLDMLRTQHISGRLHPEISCRR